MIYIGYQVRDHCKQLDFYRKREKKEKPMRSSQHKRKRLFNKHKNLKDVRMNSKRNNRI